MSNKMNSNTLNSQPERNSETVQNLIDSLIEKGNFYQNSILKKKKSLINNLVDPDEFRINDNNCIDESISMLNEQVQVQIQSQTHNHQVSHQVSHQQHQLHDQQLHDQQINQELIHNQSQQHDFMKISNLLPEEEHLGRFDLNIPPLDMTHSHMHQQQHQHQQEAQQVLHLHNQQHYQLQLNEHQLNQHQLNEHQINQQYQHDFESMQQHEQSSQHQQQLSTPLDDKSINLKNHGATLISTSISDKEVINRRRYSHSEKDIIIGIYLQHDVKENALKTIRSIPTFEKVDRNMIKRWIKTSNRASINLGRPVDREFEKDVLQMCINDTQRPCPRIDETMYSYSVVRRCAVATVNAKYPDEYGNMVQKWAMYQNKLKFSNKWVNGFTKRIRSIQNALHVTSSLSVSNSVAATVGSKEELLFHSGNTLAANQGDARLPTKMLREIAMYPQDRYVQDDLDNGDDDNDDDDDDEDNDVDDLHMSDNVL